MKIRNDYVSNSSSSSFVLWGIELNEDELYEAYDRMHSNDESDGSDEDNESALEFGDVVDEFYDKMDTFIVDDNDRICYVGSSPNMMKDDETLRQFKERIANKLSEIFGRNVELNEIDYFSGVNYEGDGVSLD